MQKLEPTPEFAFTKELPKREKSRWAKLWDLFEEMKSLQSTEGMLIPLPLAADLANVSRQRIDQIVEDGRLKRVTVRTHAYITENSLVDFLKTVRGPGRPPHMSGREIAKSQLGQIGQALGTGFRMMSQQRAARKAASK